MSERLGFVGLGTMGAPIASRLLAAGHELVVNTRTAAHAAPLVAAGARAVETPAEVAASGATAVFACLLDDSAIEVVWEGEDGLLGAAQPGQILVEHGTFSPPLARRLAAAAEQRGAGFLDAPVTGGPEGAAAGELLLMVGGEVAALERVAPLFAAYATDVAHLGGPGAGLELKLINQLLVLCHVAAAAEAAALLRRLGLDPAASERVLTNGWAASAMLSRCLPRALAGRDEEPGAPIGLMAEIGGMVAALAAEAGYRPRLAATAQTLFDDAVRAGYGSLDLSGLVRAVELDKEEVA